MGSILFVAPNSFVVRNWLASGLAGLCQRELGLTPLFLTPFNNASFTSHDGQAYQNLTAQSNDRGEPQPFSVWLRLIRGARMRLFAAEYENGSYQIMDLAARQDSLNRLTRVASRALPRPSRPRSWLRSAALGVRPRHRQVTELMASRAIELMVVGSPGIQALDHVAMISAAKLKIPAHCVVNSWDNMTSRGPMAAWPQTLMVWNGYMKEQAQHIHRFPAERTHVVGSLQFTHYGKPVSDEESRAMYARLGLEPFTPYFFYVSAQHAAEYEREDITALAHALRSSRYADTPLVVRAHPQARQEEYRALAELPNVVIDFAPKASLAAEGGDSFDYGEIRRMAAQLSHARAVIASWGTTALLEAAIFDKPIVQLRWMESVPHADASQVAKVERFERYIHLKPFDATGCRVFCDAPGCIETTLDNLFANDEQYRARRRDAVQRLVRLPLEEAPRRIVDVLRGAQ